MLGGVCCFLLIVVKTSVSETCVICIDVKQWLRQNGYVHRVLWRTRMTSTDLFEMELAHSNSDKTEHHINRIHQKAFRYLLYTKKVEDLATQKRGIDRELHFVDKVVTVEEKVDDTTYPNLAFEWMQSPYTPGWAQKQIDADLFVYIKNDQRRAYYFRTHDLMSWFHDNREELEQEYCLRTVGVSGAQVLPVPLKRLQREVWNRVTEF